MTDPDKPSLSSNYSSFFSTMTQEVDAPEFPKKVLPRSIIAIFNSPLRIDISLTPPYACSLVRKSKLIASQLPKDLC